MFAKVWTVSDVGKQDMVEVNPDIYMPAFFIFPSFPYHLPLSQGRFIQCRHVQEASNCDQNLFE